MQSFTFPPRLNLYFTLNDEIATMLEEGKLSYAAARQLAKLAIGLLRGLKKSIASTHRQYFPEFTYQDVVRCLKHLMDTFQQVNRGLIDRIAKCWDNRRRVFVICDDYVLSRYAKKAFRCDKFRDPVKKKIGLGHNVVDTIIAVNGIELTVAVELQPKHTTKPKTRRAKDQLLAALQELRLLNVPLARIRVAIDGGYTNGTVLPFLRDEGVIYIGTIHRNKIFRLFAAERQLQQHFNTIPAKFLTVDG